MDSKKTIPEEKKSKNYDYLPHLEFTDDGLSDIVNSVKTDNSIILTDEHNYPLLKDIPDTNVVLVESTQMDYIDSLRKDKPYDTVISIGGCRTLDVGREIAEDNFISVPTVLSTSCLSSGLSIVYEDGKKLRKKATAPRRTIVPMQTIMDTPEKIRDYWTASGIGDLFARVSAVIDYHDGLTTRKEIEDTIPNIFDAIYWLKDEFTEFDYNAIQNVSKYLHNASIAAMEVGHTKFSFAGEHTLFDEVVAYQRKKDMKPATHGQIVSIGTLLTANLFGKVSGDYSVFEDLKAVYEKLDLPTTYSELENFNIPRDDLIRAFDTLTSKPESKDIFLFNEYKRRGPEILDSVYMQNE